MQSIIFLFHEAPLGFVADEMQEYPFLLWVLALAIVPSFFEELVFRGVILHEFRGIPIKKAALINGLLFGFLHFNLVQFFMALILGVILAYFMHYTRNILAPILGHFVWNMIPLAGMNLLYGSVPNPGEISSYYFSPGIDIIVLGVASVIFAVPFVILMKKFIAYNESTVMSAQREVAELECDGK